MMQVGMVERCIVLRLRCMLCLLYLCVYRSPAVPRTATGRTTAPLLPLPPIFSPPPFLQQPPGVRPPLRAPFLPPGATPPPGFPVLSSSPGSPGGVGSAPGPSSLPPPKFVHISSNASQQPLIQAPSSGSTSTPPFVLRVLLSPPPVSAGSESVLPAPVPQVHALKPSSPYSTNANFPK
ncbi:hypothetical protein D9756_010174 [Leucocoprinus leucothites]|uniref:Uncharacterized protein n=1 Tax=Leucocoprinus leucothites TaxID=201217 RepID=A0A8H5FSG0_9AGAR|nr:hypothetical protein D9756_010174 [Leucoagaricus leucothites]